MDKPEYGLAIHGNIDALYTKEEDFTDNGKCSECGACCTHHLHIMPSEIGSIKQYIKRHHIRPVRHNHLAGNQKASIDFLCPFLDTNKPDKKCRIYPVRPAICKAYNCSKDHTAIEHAYLNLAVEQTISLFEFIRTGAQEINVAQTFYPELYIPKKDDFVVINQVHIKEFLKHNGRIFVVTGNVRIANDKIEYLLVDIDNSSELWFDIQGLTRIEFS